jgi:hypothetical protein
MISHSLHSSDTFHNKDITDHEILLLSEDGESIGCPDEFLGEAWVVGGMAGAVNNHQFGSQYITQVTIIENGTRIFTKRVPSSR